MKNFDYVKLNSVGILYLIIGKADRYFEENNGNKYLTLVHTDENKEILTKHVQLWDEIENLTEKISGELGDYHQKYMKIKFNSDDNRPLNKILKFRSFKETTSITHKFF